MPAERFINMALSLISYGTIKRERKWSLPDKTDEIICRYNFFYILAHDVGIASSLKWYLSSNPEVEITPGEVKNRFQNNPPHLGLWEGYSLAILLGVALVLILLGH